MYFPKNWRGDLGHDGAVEGETRKVKKYRKMGFKNAYRIPHSEARGRRKRGNFHVMRGVEVVGNESRKRAPDGAGEVMRVRDGIGWRGWED